MDIVTRANKLVSEGIALLPEDAKEDFRAAANKTKWQLLFGG